jgi:hypothetical protein
LEGEGAIAGRGWGGWETQGDQSGRVDGGREVVVGVQVEYNQRG